ncbi:hypothetical protein Emtol_2722 [Emticicia oligotrophica DSM 17448]|uniref:Uncharacterized protein n=1 Tax=Emticicia oligotrophica (strain DSM 17448 / CIP 109782 / MTCC 6937 / GPTSA100-15) TaxID=929562 RepID=A0ABM5N356_EMTOG|nr:MULTISPECIES: DUF6157 family protein [Emticicia]AFK03858.1 hypothetical protein Emtol_2722 [Emticicia oligotrophica DSM 17448]
MKIHTTNYESTLIAIADDCPANTGEMPPHKGDKKSVANLQFDILRKHPYKYTSDDIIFQVFAERNDLTEKELTEARTAFFSKGQACLRTSPLTKRYGWGVHHNEQGKVAIYACDSSEYEKLLNDKSTTVVKAMRSSR